MKKIALSILAASGLLATGGVRAQGGDSLSVEQVVQRAIENAPAIKQAQASLDAAKARTNEATVIKKPMLDGEVSYTRIDPVATVDFPVNGKTIPFSFAPNNNYNVQAVLQQVLYDFGKSDAQINVARSAEKSADDNFAQIKSSVAYQAIQLYYGILAFNETLRVEEEQKKILGENLGLSQEKEKQGTATSLDPLSTRVRIASIESQEADVRAAKQKQEAALRRLLGMEAGAPLVLQSKITSVTINPNVQDLVNKADAQRAEIQLAKDAVETARLQVEAAKFGDKPTVVANVAAGVKDGYPPELNKPFVNWAGTIALRVPILNGNRTEYQIAEAQANYEGAQSRLIDLERNIQSEVEVALADVISNSRKLELTKVQIAQAREALDVALVRYRNGAATNLEYLTAQSALEQAEIAQAQTEYNYLLSQYSVNRAVGEMAWR